MNFNLIIWWLFVVAFVFAQDPVANLPQGRIVGMKFYTEYSPVQIFLGIPYATPPVGRYRFSAPERHPGWNGTLYAHRMPPRCPQIVDGESDNIKEDCLFLNIWTPRLADGNSLPVVVLLYSESWERGGVALPCQDLAAEGVVVVTVAYRLHVFSFFTLRSIWARGNLALLDQYLALLWIRDNIAAFGGDPTAITLVGHSAGADSVLYHVASPRTIGLFQRAVVMSPRDIWNAIDKEIDLYETETERISREMARSLGCTSQLDQEIIHCMRARSLTDILSLYSKFNWSMQPIPDDFLPNTEQYLPTSLSEALSTGKQLNQLLLGTTDLESVNNDDDYDELLNRDASYIMDYANSTAIPEVLQMFSLQRTEVAPMLVQAVLWEYWGVKPRNGLNVEYVEALARMRSSAKWSAGCALLAARLARRVARLYVYRYEQPGVDLHGYGQRFNFSGAVHGADLVALLGDPLLLQAARRPSTRDEKRISTSFRKYIVNFVKSGSPGAEERWPRYRVGDSHIFEVRNEDSTDHRTHSANKDVVFWLQYLPQLSKLLTPPERVAQLALEKGDDRLRGGVFAMCGVSAVLLLLLFACALLLRRERVYRSSIADSSHL